jgi:plasmid stabilization system protein ParE
MARPLDLQWSSRALSDLQNIIEFVAADKPGAARKLARAIRARTENLRSMPFVGREAMPGVRELVVHSHYPLSYRINNATVEILQVWHTARQRPRDVP